MICCNPHKIEQKIPFKQSLKIDPFLRVSIFVKLGILLGLLHGCAWLTIDFSKSSCLRSASRQDNHMEPAPGESARHFALFNRCNQLWVIPHMFRRENLVFQHMLLLIHLWVQSCGPNCLRYEGGTG